MAGRPRSTARRLRDRPGRQLERTELAWERSTLSLVAAAVLLLVRHVEPTWGRIALAAADLGLALLVVALGRRRGRLLRAREPRPASGDAVPDASREVLLVSVGAMTIALATAVLVAVQR